MGRIYNILEIITFATIYFMMKNIRYLRVWRGMHVFQISFRRFMEDAGTGMFSITMWRR